MFKINAVYKENKILLYVSNNFFRSARTNRTIGVESEKIKMYIIFYYDII